MTMARTVSKLFLSDLLNECSQCTKMTNRRPLCRQCHDYLYPDDTSIDDLISESSAEDPLTRRRAGGRSQHCSKQKAIASSKKELSEKFSDEVLLKIFLYLDDISLWCCSQVCKKWNNVIKEKIPDDQWYEFTKIRWPLHAPYFPVPCWRSVYHKLIQSACCIYCLMQVEAEVAKLSCADRYNRRLAKVLKDEEKELSSDPPDGIEAMPLDQLNYNWHVSIAGPANSPYDGGYFLLHVRIPLNYPMHPPTARFITKVFHPNISFHGDVGIDMLHFSSWTPAMTLSNIFIGIQAFLTDANVTISMQPSVSKLFEEEREKFDSVALMWTEHYAMHHLDMDQRKLLVPPDRALIVTHGKEICLNPESESDFDSDDDAGNSV